MAKFDWKRVVTGAAVIALVVVPTAAFAAAGATAASPSAASSATHMTSTRHRPADVSRAQEALNKAGATLKVDGKLGPKTRAAIEAFQRKHNLGVTGKLDEPTEAALMLH